MRQFPFIFYAKPFVIFMFLWQKKRSFSTFIEEKMKRKTSFITKCMRKAYLMWLAMNADAKRILRILDLLSLSTWQCLTMCNAFIIFITLDDGNKDARVMKKYIQKRALCNAFIHWTFLIKKKKKNRAMQIKHAQHVI